jgi:AraC-like DNA-binding protein
VPGILNARTAQEKFQFTAVDPDGALAPFVASYWFVAWDLRGQEPYEQHVLTYPSVNMTFTAGAHRSGFCGGVAGQLSTAGAHRSGFCGGVAGQLSTAGRCRVAGVQRGRFSEVLRDAGRVFGVRFRPGGFRPFLGAPVSTITDRFVPVESVFGAPGRDLARAVLAADDPGAVAVTDRFLLDCAPRTDPVGELVAMAVARIVADPALTRVELLARELGLGVRRLQRMFAEYVGVGPKWVIRRYRLHEAAAHAMADPDWGRLAAELGYSDQAHLVRDFTAIVGVPPARYARAQ